MKNWKRILGAVFIIAVLFHIVWFNPFTAKGAIRWSVLWNGFIREAYVVETEPVSMEDVDQIGDLSSADFTPEQSVYRIVSPTLKNEIHGTKMQYWVVTHKNILYEAEYSCY
ncbi:MAG: hypothetical protein Q4F21_07740 [Lachnospiraceae bacterium]|nr:hypothetical protein [Lachnospiraceae bacterium]